MRILIVSIDFDTRAIFGTALRHSGFDVRELAEPDAVVAEALDCDVVVTDYPTRLSDGETVIAELRHDPRTAKLKILNATTHVEAERLLEAEKAGADATVVLPAFPGTIVKTVRELLSLARCHS